MAKPDTIATEELQDCKQRLTELENMLEEQSRELRDAIGRVQRKARLLDLVSDAVFVVDKDMVIVSWNHGAELQYGWPPGDVLGRDIRDVLKTEVPGMDHNELYELVARDCHWRGELLQYKRNGETIFVDAVIVPYIDANGDSSGMVEVNRDITERKKAEEEFRLFKHVMDNATEGLSVTDPQMKLVYVNKSYEILHGKTARELLGHHALDCGLTPQQRSSLEPVIDAALKEHGAWSGEVSIHRPDGTDVPVLVAASQVSDDDGAVLGWAAMLTDVSELKEIESQLRDVNCALDAYARTVSHDLRSPLSAVILSNQMLSDTLETDDIETLRAEAVETCESTRRNIDKAYALVSDLLSLAESGQKPTAASEVDVSEVVDRILEEKASDIEDRHVMVARDDDFGRVYASETHIYQVFSNLIGNSIKHNDSAEPEVLLRHLEDTPEGAHHYLVQDNSSGIPEDKIASIFKPFVKSPSSDSTGLGLAIVKKIVDVYGGTLRVYDHGGACFEFTLKDMTD